METKVCIKCKLELPINNFYKSGKYYHSYCKNCASLYGKETRHTPKFKERRFKYRHTPEQIQHKKEYNKKYWQRSENKEKSRDRKKTLNYRIKRNESRKKPKNKEKTNNYARRRRQIDPLYRMKHNLRSRVFSAFKNILHIKKDCHTFDIIGLSPMDTKRYIESKFTNGMTWDNMGFRGWHIDHIIPLSTAKTKEELIKLCHYTNLQPLWAEDNRRKSNKIV